jgi:hypothetical protein
VAVLIDRGGDALDLDAQGEGGCTALYFAASEGHADIVRLLLQAGADPSILNEEGDTPLDPAEFTSRAARRLLRAALIEPQRTRALFRARALIDTGRTVTAAAAVLARKGLPTVLHQDIIAMAVPPHVAGRVAQAQELPGVSIQHDDDNDAEDEKRAACLKYALGLEGGGGVVLEGQEEPAVGMLPEVFVELLELLVPKWDPAQKGRPLGRGTLRWRKTATTRRSRKRNRRTRMMMILMMILMMMMMMILMMMMTMTMMIMTTNTTMSLEGATRTASTQCRADGLKAGQEEK